MPGRVLEGRVVRQLGAVAAAAAQEASLSEEMRAQAAAAVLTLVTLAAMATAMLSLAVHDAGRGELDGRQCDRRRPEQECRLFV
jgi:hypothetical protein